MEMPYNFQAPPNKTTGICETDILIISGGTYKDLGICGPFTDQHRKFNK